MNRRALLVAVLLLAGCARGPGWVPELVVGGRLAQRSRGAPASVGWGWQVTGGLRWRLEEARAPEHREAPRPAAPAPEGSLPCASAELCAWERLERERWIEAALGRP